MGLIEDIEALDLSDEHKAPLLARAREEQAERDQRERERLRKARRGTVEAEVQDLKQLFGDTPELIGAMKYARRVFLSDDEEPGLVLLTDDELELSDDQRTGSRERTEVTSAQVLREFINLLPKNDQGRILLSDQVPNQSDTGRPGSGNEPTDEEKSEAARKRLGVQVERRDRSKRYGAAGVGGVL